MGATPRRPPMFSKLKEYTVTAKQTGGEMTVIGQGTTIKGEVDFDNGARILGVFEGKIRSKSEVQIGDTARCKADVEAASVVVEGTLEGNITASERLSLEKTAHFTGDLSATKLLVEEGASFVGHCRVGEHSGQGTTAKPATPATPKITTPLETEQVDFKPPWKEKAAAETGAA